MRLVNIITKVRNKYIFLLEQIYIFVGTNIFFALDTNL
jgi:hypothetical protein